MPTVVEPAVALQAVPSMLAVRLTRLPGETIGSVATAVTPGVLAPALSGMGTAGPV